MTQLSQAHSDIEKWIFIRDQLAAGKPVMLMVVIHHQGSSPGRQGFKMAVNGAGDMIGSLGGGIMEHKLVEWAKSLMAAGNREVLVKHQIHRDDEVMDRSGMICSGEQTIALAPLFHEQLEVVSVIIEAYVENQPGNLKLSAAGLGFLETPKTEDYLCEQPQSPAWTYYERGGYQHFLHIAGGGHISLALSKLARDLDFHITVYDDREKLNTLEQNEYCHARHQVEYPYIHQQIPAEGNQYMVVMTFGYRTDKIVLQALKDLSFKYLGLLGSKAKVKQLLEELENEQPGITDHIDSPAGINIHSQTPAEIAVSIAARLIEVRNG